MIKKLTNQEKLAKIKEYQDKIDDLREQRIKEITTLLDKIGGLFIDDKLLAGFVKYSLLESNKDTKWLSELYQIGKEVLPSKKTKDNSRGKKNDSRSTSPENLIQKGA